MSPFPNRARLAVVTKLVAVYAQSYCAARGELRMARRRRLPEANLYPWIRTWLLGRGCFDAAINPGVLHGRLDVVGLRDVGGDLSGEAEVVSVEVKVGGPFATAA